jgi:hypothetical protein
MGEIAALQAASLTADVTVCAGRSRLPPALLKRFY